MIALRNEQDVREEIATPLLHALGYVSGTVNGIERELRLRYQALQLGRKKPNDAPLPLGGSADYVLTVAGAGRWILETKPPGEEISVDDIDQAISYARHPEVSGCYAALLNGRRLVLYHASQSSNDVPRLDIAVEPTEELAKKLAGVLSPAAIRRDCAPPKVDLRMPLAEGYRGEAAIVRGWNKQLVIEVDSAPKVLANSLGAFEQQMKQVIGMQSAASGGRVWRDQESRVRARISWLSPHEAMIPFLQATGLDQFEYVCLGEIISTDPDQPSVFDILSSFQLREGQVIYDLLQRRSQVVGLDTTTTWQGQATGFLDGSDFVGLADFRASMKFEVFPTPIVLHFVTQFSFTINP